MKEKTFTVKADYTKIIVLNVLEKYAKKGKLTNDKEKLLSFIRYAKYDNFELRYNKTDFTHPYNYRVYVWNEITYQYERLLNKADKFKWLPFLEHELYDIYQMVIFDMKEGK